MANSSLISLDPTVAPAESRTSLTDAELVDRFRNSRSQAAFEQIVVRFGPLVLSVARRNVEDPSLAEDVFQATFLALFQSIDRIREPSSIASWLYGTALRVSKRANRRHRQTLSIDEFEPMIESHSILDEIAERHELRVFDEELNDLPETYRLPLVLHYVDGLTYEETATSLGTSVGAIRGRLQRGARELKRRLIRRNVRMSVVLASVLLTRTTAEASISGPLLSTTVNGSLSGLSGAASPLSATAVQLASQETSSMFVAKTVAATLVCVSIAGSTFFGSAEAVERPVDDARVTTIAGEQPISTSFIRTEMQLIDDGKLLAFADERDRGTAPKPVLSVKYGDGKPDGKKSIAGTGQMVGFSLPDASQKLRSIRVHCARYGTVKAPDEDVEVSIVTEDNGDVLHSELVPYSRFRRGESRWTTIAFEDPIEVPTSFWVILDFNAERTKGVYVSYDSSTDGSHSKVGLPGASSKAVGFAGDWMVQAILTKPE